MNPFYFYSCIKIFAEKEKKKKYLIINVLITSKHFTRTVDCSSCLLDSRNWSEINKTEL